MNYKWHIDLSKIGKVVDRSVGTTTKEYKVYLSEEFTCSMTLTNGRNSPKKIIPNLRLIFNPTTHSLMSAEVLRK